MPRARVYSNKNRRNCNETCCYRITEQFSSYILLAIFIVLGLLFWLAYASITFFPTPTTIEKLDSEPASFNADNAYEYVRYFSEDIGPRYIGTRENEVVAVEYILKQVQGIIETKHPDIEIECRHEKMNGTFQRIPKYFSSNGNYVGIQNIVVKLQPKNVDPRLNYILMNAHFDTVPMSPGAGDDATMVGVMLELLRVFSKENVVRHPIVFLFNGCEENGLYATHAFITQDPWYPKVGVLLNLEVTGAGGKELVFQANPQHPWLMNSYSQSVPRPYANVIAEELFGSDFIQSDTDYSNFKYWNKPLPAMDFAHVRDCYTYHTQYDDIHNIDKGSLQHTGDNLFALIKEIDVRNEPDNFYEIADEDASGNVYFDYLGWFFVFYKEYLGVIVNSVLFVVLTIITGVCAYIIKGKQGLSFGKIVLEYIIALVIQLLSMVLGICALLFIAWIFDACGRSMSWYYNVWLIWGLYFCPFNFVNMILPYAYIKYKETRNNGEISTSFYTQLALHAQCNLICLILIILTAFQIRSAYLVLISTLFYFFTTLLNVIFGLVWKGNKWLYLHCLGQLLPSLYYFYVYAQVLESMIPIGARTYNGSETNPDNVIAMITAIFAILSTGFWAPILNMFKQRKLVLGMFLSIFVLFVILAVTPLGFPYKEREAPQRFTIWHAKREFFDYTGSLVNSNSNAGYYVYGYDRHGASTVDHLIDRFRNGIKGEEWCKEELLCGIPWVALYYRGNRKHNYWIPAEDPPIPANKRPALSLLSLESISESVKKYSFAISGPQNMNVALCPMPGVKILNWSALSTMRESHIWNDRPVYFLYYLQGSLEYYFQKHLFDVTVEISNNFTSNYYFDIALSGHFVHDETVKSSQFVEFTNAFPKWANVQNWTSYYVAHQYR